MNKIAICLFLGVLISFQVQAQQGFEDGVPPSGWIQFKGDDDPGGSGQYNQWYQSGDALNGNFSAGILNENAGSITEDWLVSPRFDPPNNTKYVVFKQKQSYTTDYGNTYSIRISTTGGTPTPSDYVIVEEWGEDTFTSDWTTKIVDVSSFNNQIYVAFVMSQNSGDDWFIDDVELVDDPVIPNCPTSPFPVINELSATVLNGAVTLSWDAPAENVSEYEIFFGTTSGSLSSIGKAFKNSYEVPNLNHSTTYYWRVVPMNPAGTATTCTEWSFTTESIPTGSNCTDPIVVSSLPYNSTDDTGNYLDVYSTSTCNDNYMTGDEVVYTYTPSSDASININLSGIAVNYTGLHVLDGCPNATPTCVAFFGNDANKDDIDLSNVSITNGTTYYIVISTWAGVQNTAYTLDITQNSCTNLSSSFTLVEDCDNSGGFFIDVDITDLGSATSLTITDNQGFTSGVINSIGTTQIGGPYTNGTDVVVTVTNNQDGTCAVISDTITQIVCPPDNDLCIDAIEISPSTTGSEVWITGTTVGNTVSGEVIPANLSCVSGVGIFGDGNDTWFKTRVPAAGDITITTQSSGSTVTDTFLTVFSGNCGALVEEGCNIDGEFNYPFSEVVLTNMTIDDVLYIRVSRTAGVGSDGEFQIATHAVDAVLSTNENRVLVDEVLIYPNPVTDIINVESRERINSIRIYNILGQEVKYLLPDIDKTTIDINNLESGMYIIKVQQGEVIKTRKIFKE